MDVHIGEISSQVRPVDDRTLLSPEVLERLVREVLAALDSNRSTEARRVDETQLWSSVRAGTGR
jgi:hypothetical protein